MDSKQRNNLERRLLINDSHNEINLTDLIDEIFQWSIDIGITASLDLKHQIKKIVEEMTEAKIHLHFRKDLELQNKFDDSIKDDVGDVLISVCTYLNIFEKNHKLFDTTGKANFISLLERYMNVELTDDEINDLYHSTVYSSYQNKFRFKDAVLYAMAINNLTIKKPIVDILFDTYSAIKDREYVIQVKRTKQI